MIATATGEITRWQDIHPGDAVGLDLRRRTDITAPLNEEFNRCPWPWHPQSVERSRGRYHCPFCWALCVAGEEHTDYAFTPVGWLLDDCRPQMHRARRRAAA